MNKTITIENYDPKVHVCEACRDTDTHCCGEPCRTCLVNMALSDGGRTINWQPREPEWVPAVGDRFTSSDGRECEVVAIRGATICCYDGAAFVQTTAEYWVKGATNIRRAEQRPQLSEPLLRVQAEVERARVNFPTNRLMLAALVEEVGELANAIIEGGDWQTEALHVACVAVRIMTEGDSTHELEARVEVVE